jgi:ATP-dependent RNA helicase RhlE
MPADARGLADTILKNPVTVQVGVAAPVRTVSHALYPVSQTEKKQMLLALLDRTATGKVLIFTRTKHRARGLARDLDKQKLRVAMLQGNMSQNQRQQALDGFRGKKYDILVATDIAARGIDVEAISHVINFDMPDTVDAYTHRIGRTGRMDLTGDAFTLMVPEDAPMVKAIEKVLGYRIESRRLEGFEYVHVEAAKPVEKNGGDRRSLQPQHRQPAREGHRGQPSGGRPLRAGQGRPRRSGR